MATSLDVGLLGPLEVMRDGETAGVAAPKQRALLAMLALEAPRVVSLDVLMDQLWDGAAPRSAAATVQVYVSQLRKVLGATAIATRRPGYALDVGEGCVDVAVFGERYTRAQEHIDSGDLRVAANILKEALALWRGAALSEFVYESWASGPAQLLEEHRLVAREDLVDAQLGLGHARDLVGELESLVRQHPLRERLRGQLMLALYRSGRQADALEAYQDGWRALVEQLGIDPSPMLVELERRILQQDPTLGATVARSREAAAASPNVAPAAHPVATETVPGVGVARRERKVVSVLFCDMVDFTAASASRDPEDVDTALEQYYATVRNEIEQFGGVVEKFIGDAVMAVFGVPAVHEDDPERAVRAALGIVERVGADDGTVGVRVRIGITTGEVLVRLAPTRERGEAMVSGDVVNTASRLQTAAPPGAVLVDEATFRATNGTVLYRDRQDITVKGKPDSIPCWIAERAEREVGEADEDLVPLVGREHELGALLNALARMRNEESTQLVSLVGVPGIGKTRLVAELQERVADGPDDVRWLRGRSLAYGEGIAFWALGEIVKAEAGVSEADTSHVAEKKLRTCVERLLDDPSEADWVVDGLGTLVGIESGEREPAPGRGDGVAVWRRFIEAMADERPTVLVFEDLHWADDALLDFIDLLVDRVTAVPLLIVSTGRPEFLQRRPSWGGGKANATTVSLPPLGTNETHQLIAGFLAGRDLDPQHTSHVLTQAEGNALFVREYVRMLHDNDHGDYQDVTGIASTLPGTIHGLIAARLDALSEEDKQVAQIASVIGRVSWLGAIAALSEHSGEDVVEALHRLEQRQMLRRARRSTVPGETEFAFTHALIQDIAYGQIPRAERAVHHVAAAAWIENMSGQRDDRIELLGHHLLAAATLRLHTAGADPNLNQRACRALGRAGDRAMTLSAYTAAANHYTAALGLTDQQDDSHTARLLLGLGKALFQTGDILPPQLEQAAAMFERLGDTCGAADAHAVWAAWLVNHGRPDAAAVHARRACDLLYEEPDSPEKAYAVLALGRIGAVLNDPSCWESLVAGSAMAERLGSIELRTRGKLMLGEERLFRDDPAGIEDIQEALRLARQHTSSSAELCKLCAVVDLLALGRIEESHRLLEEGLKDTTRLQIDLILHGHEVHRGILAFVGGNWAVAKQVADAVCERSGTGEEGGETQQVITGDEVMIPIHSLLTGEGISANGVTETLHAINIEGSDRPTVLALGGFVLTCAAHYETASSVLDDWVRLVQSGRGAFPTSFAWPLAAKAMCALGRNAEVIPATTRPRIRTPWLEAADSIARDDHQTAANVLRTIGAEGLVRLIGA